ncbi:hypothetical protein IAE29_22800 [Ochrobactrum sp. S46]|nr:hypothetical protein [Ochrobactrum sp. S45]MBK0046162.1 hypothetical protein [Ochrobactrum sp. S46]
MSEKGRTRRFAAWNYKRAFGMRIFFGAASKAAEDAADNVQNTIEELRPAGRLKKRSFGDRYLDGGVDRFHQLSSGLKSTEIDAALAAWDRDSSIYMVAGCVALASIPILYFLGYASFYLLIGGCLVAIVTFSLAMKADFRAWQIRQGRVGSVRDYFNDRLPSNMQILTKDD